MLTKGFAKMGSVIQFFENKSILVTGVTGFLAKVFVEKILRVQPNVKKLYLLLRAADADSAAKRFKDEVTGKDLFNVLKEELAESFNPFIMEKITLVPGDVSFENLGVTSTNILEEMWKNLDCIVHSAATTDFDGRYDSSFRINTLGAKHMLDFTKKCANIKIFMHVSTAYVTGESKGLILERPCDMGDTRNLVTNIEMENKLLEKRVSELNIQGATQGEIASAMKDLGLERSLKHGWVNTYTFTKAMGESYLVQMKENIPLIIIRPSIITSTYKEPFPGWVEGFRSVDWLFFGYGKGKLKFLLGDPISILDVIPADMVVNAMLVAIAAHADWPYTKHNNHIIYNICSSITNPMKMKSIQDYGVSYFKNNPLISKDGKPIKVVQPTLLTSMASYKRYTAIHYLFPLKVLKFLNVVFCMCFESIYQDLNRKSKSLMRLMELYSPYLFHKGILDDANTQKLRIISRESENVFYLDPTIVDWEKYFTNTHIPGVIKHVLK